MAEFLSKRFGYPLYFSLFWQAPTCPDITRYAPDKAGNRHFALQNLAAKQNTAVQRAPSGKPLDSFSAAMEC
ncbi:hypothetical protein [Sinorhizobium fredii]|uniref:Uncharacterized protein n=1 Tax=Rhizobium fredii TaxID=380 RepID=A0A844AE28_RHIFR|nr:hypothetical protein [Sinorhizobium fredii]MQW94836.1 hypothetical protein [Sinorhizobium fredii]MQX11434.1 hypothetical protein [Sinorhizobium fredii]UTY48192.1 hypothetical protein EPK84_16140 [Sinorhizobium fredii]